MTPRVLALGAWLKNRACLLDGAARQWSPLHGDLGDPANCIALEQSAERLLEGTEVHAIAHDLHPDFHSTRLAHTLAQRLGVPAIGVQHHHAHIAAVQAEHAFAAPLIGLALDGFGLGTDGTAWGGELLWVNGAQWQRLGHLSPLALPGGDVAAREPWRMAARPCLRSAAPTRSGRASAPPSVWPRRPRCARCSNAICTARAPAAPAAGSMPRPARWA
jgi:hydrogenase maturation protein HypF